MPNIAREMLYDPSCQVLDASSFLNAEYQVLSTLFGSYERTHDPIAKQQTAERICRLLTINMQMEEDVFYPTVKRTFKEKGMVSAAIMNHTVLKYLIAEIAGLDCDSPIYDIKIRVLSENVKHCNKEKQSKIFSKVNTSGKIDVWKLGEQLALRKAELSVKTAVELPV